ncbi:MAG TPA: hypothetical protein VFK27_03080, partial [Bacillales bacterium]|nr:hypothetical protein [Bacillales bacterium]
MAMKAKKPGDHIILRLKNNESPLIIDWMNHQSNLSDAIRFLIEEEIKANAVRDLQEYIPAKRKPLKAAAAQAENREPQQAEPVAVQEEAEPVVMKEEESTKSGEPPKAGAVEVEKEEEEPVEEASWEISEAVEDEVAASEDAGVEQAAAEESPEEEQ